MAWAYKMLAWYRQLDDAKDRFEVVGVVRDYLAGWSPKEISRLPVSCRPGRIRDEQDLESLHECLVDEYRTTRAEGDDLTLLQQITGLMVRACIRLTELREEPSSGGSSAPQESKQPVGRPEES